MQISLFYDYQSILDSSSFYRKYDALFLAVEKALVSSAPVRRAGRRGYGFAAYLKALIYKHSQQIKSIPDLLRDLESRPLLCQMIGFPPGRLPDESRFYEFIGQTNNSALESVHHAANRLLLDAKVISLDVVIADSKPIMANTRHNNPKNSERSLDKNHKIRRNPAVTLGYFSYLKQPNGDRKKSISYFWGYRTHVLISAEGVPLVEITKPNNQTDSKVAKALIRKLIRIYGKRQGRVFIGDAAYDDRELYDFVVNFMKGEPFIPINPRGQQPEKIIGANGCPCCDAGLEMKFAGLAQDGRRIRKKFRCPLKVGFKKERVNLTAGCPVNHEKFSTGKCYGCTAYIDVTEDARAQVPRQSLRYLKLYDMRTAVERYFSRLGDREAEQTTHYVYRAVRNQMTIAHLTQSLVAIAAVIMQRPEKIRCFKSLADAA